MGGSATGRSSRRERWVGNARTGGYTAAGASADRGQVIVLMALLLPMLLTMGAIVIGIGNWYTHARHLQTKVDAAAFAGGGVWGFPCGADIDANIEAAARTYVGDHTAADGALVTGSYNPQVGGIGGDRVYVSLNQGQWWSDGFPAADFTDPAGSVCASKVLDVKATEADVSPLWRWIPLFPHVKRKARVQIEEIAGLTGLLPIAVRLPQPLSAAAVFYDESSPTKKILAVKPFRLVCIPSESCIVDPPPGLGVWTTQPSASDPAPSLANVNIAAQTGVVVATSVRPACGAGTPPAGPPCMNTADTWLNQSVDAFCQQAGSTLHCYDADGSGGSQAVNSGIHFIRGHTTGPPVGDGRPELRNAWLDKGSCPSTGFFNSIPGSCSVQLNVVVDIGSLEEDPPPLGDGLVQTRIADNVEVRYCLVRSGQTDPLVCDPQFGPPQDMQCSDGPGNVTCSTVSGTHPLIALDSRENSFAIQVRLRRTTVPGFPGCTNDPASEFNPNCRFFYIGNRYFGDSVLPTANEVLDEPVHRSFMGHLERTGPLKWLRLTVDFDCDPATPDWLIGHYLGEDAASRPAGENTCYIVDMGMAGGLARDQDEPPIAFNLGDNSSQRAYVDCDPNISNLKSEIVAGCQTPSYAANRFDPSPYCPGASGFFNTPKAAPFDTWPPFRCVLTQTGNSSQVIQGFNDRIFHKTNNPSCPPDNAFEYVEGRNYWHRMNNDYKADTFAWDGQGPPGPGGAPKGNTLLSHDPRLVTLFFTTYDSFTDTGNEVYPIVGFGNFYVTGYGETINGNWKGGKPEDPCDQGNDGDLSNGTGNEPPPDLDMSRNTRWVWGHFLKDVTPAPFTTGGSGVLCNPDASFQPCVAVLVE